MWTFPATGAAPPQDDIRSQDDMLASVDTFVSEMLGDVPFALVGLSRGSYIARGILYSVPGRVTGAALIVPGGNPSSSHPRPEHKVVEPDPTIRSELPDDEIWAFDNFLVVQRRDIVEKRRNIVKPAKKVHDQTQEARVKAAFDFSFARSEAMLVFNGPSLIVARRQDSTSGYLDSIDLAHRFPRATLAILDAAGHGLEFERPDLFTALVRDWLMRLAMVWHN
jgi:pimeloyl-ACP methyl ester carboxylesterase